MNQLLDWVDQRTGFCTEVGNWFRRPIAGGPAWRSVWPSTIVFAFVTQALTGLVLWMYYSPGAQSAWESVYYVQYQVQFGWLLRAIHHYSAQVMLVLVGIYLVQMIVRGTYRAPREFLFWTVLLMGLITLGLNLTGDLLSWDQNSFWSTRVRTGFLFLLPGVGNSLFKLAAGGAEFGSLTLTRFLALHIGALTAVFVGLLVLHCWLARRNGLENLGVRLPVAYWPGQAFRDMAACLIVLGVVLALSAQHGVIGPDIGVELGAPANPIEDPGTARPEWSFRGLYQFRELFPSSVEILPIFVLSGLTVLVFFAMPIVGRLVIGHLFNIAFTLVVLGGLAVLSWESYATDGRDEKYQKALAEGHEQAERIKELAASPQGIPVSGALTLMRDDAKIQGPLLFQQHCASCHDYSEADGTSTRKDPTSAPDLRGFAGRDWIRGMLDPKQIVGPKYYGNTKFKKGQMVDYVKSNLTDADPKEVELYVMALSAEAGLRSQREADAGDAARIAKGKELVSSDCTDCHTFHGKGTAKGADMTGYGNRDWLIGIIGNPAHKRFYGKENDRMPAYAGAANDPNSRILSEREIGLLADWLRGEWYEAEEE